MVRRLSRFASLLVALVACLVACKPGTTLSPGLAETPVAAPPRLTAEGTLRAPDVFWSRVRQGSGARLANMPDTAAGAILAWAGADASVGPLVAGDQPFQLAFGEGTDGAAYAVAMKLRDPTAARKALVDAPNALFGAESTDGLLRLTPRTPDAAAHGALAMAGAGYLVVASSPADLLTLGAYAARTLPTRPAPSPALELRADPGALGRTGKAAPELGSKLTSMLAASLRELLPPEVDSTALAACFTPALRDTVGMAGDLTEATLDVDAGDGDLEAVITLVLRPGDTATRRRITDMHPASAAPLLDASGDAIAVLFWSDTAQVRAADTGSVGPCLGNTLAPILGPGGGPKLTGLLADWARGRGDWETASFVSIPAVAGLVVRAAVSDESAVSSSVRGFADLAAQPSVADAVRRVLPLRAGGVDPIDVPRVGKASVEMFPALTQVTRGVAGAPALPDFAPPGMAWAVDGKEADVAVGFSPRDLLAESRPATTLRSQRAVERAVGALGADTSFGAVFVPAGCCKTTAPAAAPLTFAWGRRAGNGRASLTLGDELFAQILSRMTAR